MKKILILIIAAAAAFSVSAQQVSNPPVINAEAAVLIEAGNGTVLYSKNPDLIIPPASMTKLMTIHVALRMIEEGRVSEDELVPVSADADFRSLPPHSSLMFIEEGQRVTVHELLVGLALPSGNDAAIALAEHLAGSTGAFIGLMNKEAARLGLEKTEFHDASGLSELNRTTAAEYAEFCRVYIEEHPSALAELHSLENFTYPEGHNLPEDGKSVYGPITQNNHNVLAGRLDGVDGLKTGYIDESGYNIAATAIRNGRRLILVTMGGPGKSSGDGNFRRAIDTTALLTYGFYAWTNCLPEVPEDREIRATGADRDRLKLVFSRAEPLTMKTAETGSLIFTEFIDEISYPLHEGDVIGSWKLTGASAEILQTGRITAGNDLFRGSLLRRSLEKIRLMFSRPD